MSEFEFELHECVAAEVGDEDGARPSGDYCVATDLAPDFGGKVEEGEVGGLRV